MNTDEPRLRSSALRSTLGAVLALAVIAAVALVPFGAALWGDQCVLSFDTRLPGFSPFSMNAPDGVENRPSNPITSDINGWIVPEMMLVAREVENGRAPLWNPYVLLGQPLLANMAYPAYYPPNAIAYVIDPLRALAWLIVFHLALAGSFCFLYLRRIGLDLWPALLGGVATAVASWLTVRIHLPMTIATASWFFPMLFAAEGLLRRLDLRRAAWLAGAIGLAFLAGFPQLAVLETAGALLYLLVRALERSFAGSRLRVLGLGGAAVAAGLLLSSVHSLPSATLFRDSLRHSLVDPARQAERGLRGEALIGVVLPEFFGNPARRSMMPPRYEDFLSRRLLLGEDVQENPVENALWPGAVALLLALLAIPAAANLGAARALLVLAACGLILAIRSPLLSWAYENVPGMASGNPKRALVLFTLPIAALAGVGAARLFGRDPPRARGTIGVAAAMGVTLGLLAGAAALADGAWLVGWADPSGASTPEEGDLFLLFTAHRTWPRAVGFLLVAALLFVVSAPRVGARLRGVLLPSGLILLVVLELVPYAVRFNPLQETAGQYPETPAIRMLMESGERTARYKDRQLAGALVSPYFPFRSLDGGEPMVLRRVGELLEALEPGRFDVDDPRVAEAFQDPASFGHPIFLRTATPLILTREPIEGVTGLELAYEGHAEGLGMYRQRLALPRFRLVAGHEVVEDDSTRLIRLVDPGLDPRTTVLLERAPGLGLVPGSAEPPAGRVECLVDEPDRQRIRVEGLERPALLVIADSFAPGWRAEVDGAPAPVLAADHAFRAVPLPPGDHEVTLSYRPTSFRVGVLVTGLMALLLLIALAWPRRRTPVIRSDASGVSQTC